MFTAVYSRKQASCYDKIIQTHTKLVILYRLVNINLAPCRAVC